MIKLVEEDCARSNILIQTKVSQASGKIPNKSVKTQGKRERTADEIIKIFLMAILEHRLLPGTKLGEDRLAIIFNASQSKIREVLA